MERAVIIDALRSPVARAHAENGYYRDVRADDLSAHVIRALVDRAAIDPELIDDVVWGNVQQQGEQGFDVARTAGLLAGLSIETGGVTVNRNCGSSLQALNQAAASAVAGGECVQIVGGVEHMHHVPMDKDFSPNPLIHRTYSQAVMNMGLTAEYLAHKFGVSRVDQDRYALGSHQKATQATRSGAFDAEIIASEGLDAAGNRALFTEDQCIRQDASLEGLAKLSPAFQAEGGTVTAGNASPLNVGAAAMLVMSESRAQELGMKPLARIRAMAVAGVDPSVMGLGPVPATRKALERAGLTLNDIDLIELNEAFAVQAMCVIRLLGADPGKVNVRGGAIAIGHPLGASGARIACTLLHTMRDTGARYGLATMCIGMGQGIATIFEAVN